jgi:hypothetical protein
MPRSSFKPNASSQHPGRAAAAGFHYTQKELLDLARRYEIRADNLDRMAR